MRSRVRVRVTVFSFVQKRGFLVTNIVKQEQKKGGLFVDVIPSPSPFSSFSSSLFPKWW